MKNELIEDLKHADEALTKEITNLMDQIDHINDEHEKELKILIDQRDDLINQFKKMKLNFDKLKEFNKIIAKSIYDHVYINYYSFYDDFKNDMVEPRWPKELMFLYMLIEECNKR